MSCNVRFAPKADIVKPLSYSPPDMPWPARLFLIVGISWTLPGPRTADDFTTVNIVNIRKESGCLSSGKVTPDTQKGAPLRDLSNLKGLCG